MASYRPNSLVNIRSTVGVVIGTSSSYDLALKTILTQKTVHPLTSTKSWLCGEALMSTA